MDVLCSDKTGTLTEGKVRLHSAVDCDGPAERAGPGSTPTSTPRSRPGYSNPIDAAIVAGARPDAAGYREARRGALRFRPQAAERPGRRGRPAPDGDQGGAGERAGGLHARRDGPGRRRGADRRAPADRAARSPSSAARASAPWGSPTGTWGPRSGIDQGHEAGMTFLGLLVLDDPLQAGIAETIRRLRDLGVAHEDHHRRQPAGRRPRRPAGRAGRRRRS